MIPGVPESSAGLIYYHQDGISGPPPPPSASSSFTQTFLRGILASIDSKDPVVAHAWLETLLDAIDLLPPEVVKREVVPIAVSKAQIGEPVFGRQASCRLLGKIAVKLDGPSARTHVLPTVLSLGQDGDPEVRFTLCRHLPLVAKGVGLEATKDAILPQIVELSVDESSHVRVAALDTVVHLLPLLDDASKGAVIVPLIVKVSERARATEENPLLPNLAHVFGRLLHGLQPHFHPDQRNWGLDFYKSICQSGLGPSAAAGISTSRLGSKGTMPDIVPASEDKIIMHGRDTNPTVRGAVARSIHELAPLLGARFATLESQLCTLFADGSLLTLEAMEKISSSLLHCESIIAKTRNWRLHADCLEKFSCLANCISPTTILNKFVPTLFERIHTTRTLPCKVAACRTLLVFLRFTVRSEDRKFILFRMKEELCHGKSCSSRMLFFKNMIRLHHDPIPNVRLKLCSLLPKLKALISLPSDGEFLLALEDSVKKLLLVERDRDVLYTLQTVIQDLDRTETGVDGISSGNLEEDRDNDRKLREERLISNMEEQIIKMHNDYIIDDSKFNYHYSHNGTIRKRSESVPRDILLSLLRKQREVLQESIIQEIVVVTLLQMDVILKVHFYSASLENLDPSAKEFLVDAVRDDDSYPKFLMSNSYEPLPIGIRRAETPISTVSSLVVDINSTSPESSLRRSSPKNPILESKLRPPSKLKPPTTSTPNVSSSPITSTSSIIDMSSVSALAQNTLSRIPYSKLVSSTDRIQGSIERLAEKWESKRRNLTTSTNTLSPSVEPNVNNESPKSKSLIVESSPKTTMIPSKRNSLFVANKQKMRLSLTDVTSKPSSTNIKSIQKQRKKSPEKVVEEDMVTYVPPLTTSTCTTSQKAKLVTATNLIVKPLSSTTTVSTTSNTNTTASHQRSLPVPSLKYNNASNNNSPLKRGTHYHQPQSLRSKSIPPPSPITKNSSIPHYSTSNTGMSTSNNTANTVMNNNINATTTYVPKFSRVPPPKYRNPPTTTMNRRPLSQQESSPTIRAYNQLECILDRSDDYSPQYRKESRSPSPITPKESRLKVQTSVSNSLRYSSTDIPRRNNIDSRQLQQQQSFVNRRKSAHYPMSNGNYPLTSTNTSGLKSKSSQGLPAPGFSRLPVGSYGPK
ncbi:PPP4R4 [Lepeophtheirus salmonis]|uniref:PPP4R4 n=1 Tax=Lepeophtheirus salmonis TaxID=72036 RepID=A0A7R8HCT0_LEPSM|nr:PPP4R4 [Lepeophtheirus salmonis]CAF3016554.1 PPP4R4 [Lepeophtheirus salmonis]